MDTITFTLSTLNQVSPLIVIASMALVGLMFVNDKRGKFKSLTEKETNGSYADELMRIALGYKDTIGDLTTSVYLLVTSAIMFFFEQLMTQFQFDIPLGITTLTQVFGAIAVFSSIFGFVALARGVGRINNIAQKEDSLRVS